MSAPDRGVLALTALLALVGLAAGATAALAQGGPVRYRDPVFQRVQRTNDIVYGRATDIPTGQPVELRLDLYQPQGDTEPARPVLMFIHGGGFVGGDKSNGQRWADEFARRGWVVASIGYRLNQGDAAAVRIGAAVSDARQALRWLGTMAATYRLDLGRVVVGGGSAGGITALHLAYTDMERSPADADSRVAGVMDLWGALYGGESEMTAGEPPLIIVHGTEDTVVPYRNALALRDRAEAVGIPYAFHPLAGVGHGSGETAKISAWTAEFFYPLLWPGSGAATATVAPTLGPTTRTPRSPTATADPGTSVIPPATRTATPTPIPDRRTLYLPLVGRSWRVEGIARPPTAAPPTATVASTAVAGTINGCAPDQLERCRYQPATWVAASAVRALQGYTVTNTAEGRELPLVVRAATGVSGARPVVVWSHGGGPQDEATLAMNREWATALARAGYIVVQPAHISPDVPALCARLGVSDPAECGRVQWMTWYRPSDARAVVDALPALAAAFPQLAGRVDLNRVAYAGHSFGAFTSMAVAGARVDYVPGHMDVSWAHPLPRAFLALSPQGPGRFGFHDTSWRDIARPVLTATGEGDTTAEGPAGEQAEDRREPFRRIPPGDKFELWLASPDAVHGTFNLGDTGPGARFHEAIATTGLAFLDAYVLDQAPAKAWLTSSNVVVLTGGEAEWGRR